MIKSQANKNNNFDIQHNKAELKMKRVEDHIETSIC